MPKLKKRVQSRNLASIRTWLIDENPFSEYFRLSQIPEILPGGKSGFLINGSPNLVRTTEVLIEITDIDGNVIFTQPIKNYQEGLARVVSIEVYDDTPPGPGILTILGEAAFDRFGNPVPDEWVGTYNVKWQKIINIETKRPNLNQIRLYNKPTITVNERLIPFRQTVTGSMQSVSVGSITGQYVAPGVQLVGDDITNLRREVTAEGSLITSTDPVFVRQTLNGLFYAVVDGVPFTSSIENIQTITAAKLTNVLTGSDGAIVNRWGTNNYILEYQTSPTFITSSLNRSFANIKLSNLTTFTGDIQRAKFYVRGVDEGQKYELFEDVVLEAVELTVSQSSTGEQVELGEIIDQPFLNENWEVGIIANGTAYTTGDVTASYNNTTLFDSTTITGAGTGSVYNVGSNVPLLWTGITQPLQIDADAEYTVQAEIVCLKEDPNFDARMDIRLFGDVFSGGKGNELGYLITSMNSGVGQTRRTFRNFVFNFTVAAPDFAKLRFVVHSGQWFVSKVKIVSARESGFNPDQITVFSPVINRRFERLQFKAELYDANSNLVPLEIETDAIYFDGGNLVFRGSDTRIDGILTVAPSGSGPTLTTKGIYDINGNFMAGQAIAIGPAIPRVKDRGTAFFAGTSSNGPEISVGDKMYGYYDQAQNEFILQIEGTVLVGSGSNFLDIRSLIPRNSSDKYFDRVRGGQGEFEELRGRRAVSSGDWNSQVARMGRYTRGPSGYLPGTPVTSSNISASVDPLSAPLFTLQTSASITIPSTQMFYNELIYGNMTIDLQEDTITDGFYNLKFILTVKTSWQSYASASLSAGQILIQEDTIGVATAADYSPDPVLNYPIPVPSNRLGNTLYVITRLDLTFEPEGAP